MKILAVNAGSSSLKYQLFNMPEATVICSGIAERIGLEMSLFSIKVNGEKFEEELVIPNHTVAVQLVLEWMTKYNVIDNMDEIVGVGHRVVHGGEEFAGSVEVTDAVIQSIDALSEFAPLHNPANLLGILEFQKALPQAKSVVVFDTAFHQTMPEESFMYATPFDWYSNFGVRKYGFHGTSHEFVSKEAAKMLGKNYDEVNTIVCHLGNGASLCAVQKGKSIDTSMGFTPLAGVPMGTRSGDIDPAIIPYISEKLNIDSAHVVDLLNKESGFLGVSGISSDARDLMAAHDAGNERAKLTIDIYSKRIAEVIGGYFVTLGGADVIVFTAGVGENAGALRQAICKRLGAIGVEMDVEKNLAIRSEQVYVSTPTSKVKVAIIPTNEELVIAEDTFRIIN